MEFITSALLKLLSPPVGTPVRQDIFPAPNYHPIYGISEKVDHPKISTNTTILSVPPWIGTHLNGDYKNHFTRSEAYINAYKSRKIGSYYIENWVGQIDKRSTTLRQWQERRGTFMTNGDGTYVVSSRDPRNKFRTGFYERAREIA